METINQASAVTPRRRPWNEGKLIEPKPPLQAKPFWFRTRFQLARRHPGPAPLDLAIDSKRELVRLGGPCCRRALQRLSPSEAAMLFVRSL
jgi:hypothetical protein